MAALEAVAKGPVSYTGAIFAGMEWTAEAVKQLRAELGLTQDQFARAVGVRRATVADWERGIHQPQGIARSVLDRLTDRRKRKKGSASDDTEPL